MSARVWGTSHLHHYIFKQEILIIFKNTKFYSIKEKKRLKMEIVFFVFLFLFFATLPLYHKVIIKGVGQLNINTPPRIQISVHKKGCLDERLQNLYKSMTENYCPFLVLFKLQVLLKLCLLPDERLDAKLGVTENRCVLFNRSIYAYLALLPQH